MEAVNFDGDQVDDDENFRDTVTWMDRAQLGDQFDLGLVSCGCVVVVIYEFD